MTEVTRNSAMVREPNTIHSSAADESSSSTTHLAPISIQSEPQDSTMPDLSETKLRNSRSNNRAAAVAVGELRHKHAGHSSSSGDEGTHDEEDKHDDSEEVRFLSVLL